MRIFSRKTIRTFWEDQPLAEEALKAWYEIVSEAEWQNHNELKSQIRNASIIGEKRVIFNIHGNKFRLIADIEYNPQWVFVVWIGTHSDYDKIDVKTVSYD
jgi:mRNA interferase HigB